MSRKVLLNGQGDQVGTAMDCNIRQNDKSWQHTKKVLHAIIRRLLRSARPGVWCSNVQRNAACVVKLLLTWLYTGFVPVGVLLMDLP